MRHAGVCLEAATKKAQPGLLQRALQRLGVASWYLLCYSNKVMFSAHLPNQLIWEQRNTYVLTTDILRKQEYFVSHFLLGSIISQI